MLRGVEEFSTQELLELQGLLPNITQPEPMLSQKLQLSPNETPESVVLELSSDEVEQLLDALPAPTESSPIQKQLRTKLTTFLQNIH